MVDSNSMEIGSATNEEGPSERSVAVDDGVVSAEPQLVNVIVGTSAPAAIFSAAADQVEAGGLKATRIIIHDADVLKLKTTAQARPQHQTVTFNTLNRSLSVPERSYNWDPSVYDPVLPVRCKNVRGELHKDKFGSGSKGKSILVGSSWYTPTEFELTCGRGNSKDWKRSIRYAGRNLQCLIEEGILRPHAASCTCSICCDDAPNDGEIEPQTGPVRLFTPYKRRKKQQKSQPVLKLATNLRMAGTEDSVIVTPAITPQTPRSAPIILDFTEQRKWWQLEEMVKNTLRQVLELQKQVETLKNESASSKESVLQRLRIQMENEKKEALNACRVEAQMNLSRAVLEAKAEKEAAVEEAVKKTRLEMQENFNLVAADKGEAKQHCANCNREAFSECTGCHRVSYCSPFCQRKDWDNHRDECGETILSTVCTELEEECETVN